MGQELKKIGARFDFRLRAPFKHNTFIFKNLYTSIFSCGLSQLCVQWEEDIINN